MDYVTGQPYIPGSSVKGIIRSVFEDSEIITEIIKENKVSAEYDNNTIESIVEEIFDGNDVFLDAVVYRGNDEGKVLGIDYITPHKNPVKNPLPIQMVKIIPNVIFEFRFIFKKGGTLSVDEKTKIFTQIIEDFGVGAKTNVGYGNLTRIDKGKCKRCGNSTEQKPNGDYYALCKKCHSEARKCPKCNKKKITWDIKNNKWFDTCYDCKGK